VNLNGSPFVTAADARVRFLIKSTDDPLAHDGPNVIANLTKRPKRISPVYVYDKKGTELFEQQCSTPEYYLRRCEMQLLNLHAQEIAELCDYPDIVELGSGTAEKTRILLSRYADRDVGCDYYPIDVDAETMAEAARVLTLSFPAIMIHCSCAT
jgi:L-histidine Nalpha-methyltransferase